MAVGSIPVWELDLMTPVHPFQVRKFCDIKMNEQLLMIIDIKLYLSLLFMLVSLIILLQLQDYTKPTEVILNYYLLLHPKTYIIKVYELLHVASLSSEASSHQKACRTFSWISYAENRGRWDELSKCIRQYS